MLMLSYQWNPSTAGALPKLSVLMRSCTPAPRGGPWPVTTVYETVAIATSDGSSCEQVCTAKPEELQVVADGIYKYAGCYLDRPTTNSGTRDAKSGPSSHSSRHSHQEQLLPTSQQAMPDKNAPRQHDLTYQGAQVPPQQQHDSIVGLRQALDDDALDGERKSWIDRFCRWARL